MKTPALLALLLLASACGMSMGAQSSPYASYNVATGINEDANCDDMVAAEVSLTNEAQTLSDNINKDYSNNSVVSSTAGQLRQDAESFYNEYSAVVCPYPDTSAGDFLTRMNTEADQIDANVAVLNRAY